LSAQQLLKSSPIPFFDTQHDPFRKDRSKTRMAWKCCATRHAKAISLARERIMLMVSSSGTLFNVRPSVKPSHARSSFMLGRTRGSVLLIATLTGCASPSRFAPFLPNLNIPNECATSIRLVDCALSVSPPQCRTAAVTCRKGSEQLGVMVK